MLLAGKNMPIAPQSDASCTVMSLLFVKKGDFSAKQSAICSLLAYCFFLD